MEHVAGGKNGLTFLVKLDVGTQNVAITANDFFRFGIPHDELLVGILHRVENVEVTIQPRTTTCCTEGYLTETTNFTHHIGGILPCDNIDLVVALAGHAQTPLIGEFRFEHLFGNRCNNFCFHILYFLVLCPYWLAFRYAEALPVSS